MAWKGVRHTNEQRRIWPIKSAKRRREALKNSNQITFAIKGGDLVFLFLFFFFSELVVWEILLTG